MSSGIAGDDVVLDDPAAGIQSPAMHGIVGRNDVFADFSGTPAYAPAGVISGVRGDYVVADRRMSVVRALPPIYTSAVVGVSIADSEAREDARLILGSSKGNDGTSSIAVNNRAGDDCGVGGVYAAEDDILSAELDVLEVSSCCDDDGLAILSSVNSSLDRVLALSGVLPSFASSPVTAFT